MANLSSILKHNQSFVEEKKYEFYETTKFPEKKLVILTLWIPDYWNCSIMPWV
ncbi:carbonate dehydratase [Bacillus glycinifermentans]|nr:carbonate dehydratase [Bacillus glycinifermentans]